MNQSRFESTVTDWTASAFAAFDELRGQVERSVSMRMGRGDVRSAILRLLTESPMHGYQIIRELTDRSDGAWKPSAGSVYPALQLLVDEGLITSKATEGRRTYSLTAAGKTAAAELDGPAPWESTGSHAAGPRGALAKAGVEVAKAAADVARRGSTEQIAAATEALTQTAQQLQTLLRKNG